MWLQLEDQCVVNRSRARRGRSRVHPLNNDLLFNCQETQNRGGVKDSSESDNGSVINSESLNGQDDHQSMTSDLSQDLGHVERERVRRIFQEWKNNGGASQPPNVPHRNRGSRGQWLGETERERVRVVREWIQMTIQSREEQVSETGSQIDQVCDGQVADHNEGPVDNIRRPIRRLCGRQALLDLLAKKEEERRQELQGLEISQPVSHFAHRNRIQSLLRLRCFQNMRALELRSPRSTESELGLLRQRQTVSGLRGGFISRLDNNVQVDASDLLGGASENNGIVDSAPEQTDPANEIVDGANELSAPANEVPDGPKVPNEPLIEIGCPQQNEPLKENLDGICSQSDLERDSDVGPSVGINELSECRSDRCTSPQQLEAQVEASDGDNRADITYIEPPLDSSDEICLPMNSHEYLRIGSGEFSALEETHEMSEQFDTHSEEVFIRNQLDDRVQVSESLNDKESSVQVEDWTEQVSMSDESRRQGSVLSNQWRDEDQVETDGQHSLGDGELISQGALESEVGEQNDAQEDYWQENGSLETPRDWFGMPSSSGVVSGRLDTYYFSDDDNANRMELRELVNRRRVSSLLHSDFRESLDQLIQSYVDRQTHAPDDWELHEMSLPPFTALNQDHIVTYHGEESEPEIIHVEQSQRTLPRPPPLPDAHWGHRRTLSRRESQQCPGTEWEIINDLRIDMACLQQRLNNMQRMLETCMDMQLELQRSVRQEVSAALNRTAIPSGLTENTVTVPKESFKWDCVRKGICCICFNTNIDSLLYRCGHMCTCTKCADLLVEGSKECPMCQAPVIEVIRAYFIQ